MQSRIVVVGSANMDYVVQMDRFPACGETLFGEPLQLSPGGKGANQAAAAARLAAGTNATVRFVGKVGDDDAGRKLIESLRNSGVQLDGLQTSADLPSGSAMIWRDAQGNNSIVVSPAANFSWSDGDVASMRACLAGATTLLLQMEVPLKVNEAALKAAKTSKTFCILDPAPAQPLDSDFLKYVDLLTPNEGEACTLLGLPQRNIEQSELKKVAEELLKTGPRAVLIKLGDRGTFYKDSDQEILESAPRVAAKDTTAAGDIFNGALAVALGNGTDIKIAMRFANAAASISVTRAGAQLSIPTRAEVEAQLRS